MSLISKGAGQNVCISVSMMEETQTNAFQSTSNSISKLSQRQRRFTTASVAAQNLENMALEFSWDGMSTSVKTSAINAAKGKSVVVPPKTDKCQSEVVSTQNLEQFPSPVEHDYRNFKPAPKSKRKILLTPMKTPSLDNKLPSIQTTKQLPVSQKPTIEKCTEMQLQLLQGLDTMELQQKVYGIMHALYGLLLKNNLSSNCMNKTVSSDGMIQAAPPTEVETKHESKNTTLTSGRKQILPADQGSMILPSRDNNTPLAGINKKLRFNGIEHAIPPSSTKKTTPNNMNKSLPSKNVTNRTVTAKQSKNDLPTTDVSISSTTESHDISGIYELEDDYDNMSLIIDESAGTPQENMGMSCNTETDVHKLSNETVEKELKQYLIAPVKSTNLKDKIDNSKNVQNEVQKKAEKPSFQPHLFTPESIASVPVTKCIHLLPVINDNPTTINMLDASALEKHKDKNKKATTKLSHDKTIVPLHKFESFAQAKLEGNIKEALKQKTKRTNKKKSKSENKKPTISHKHTTKRDETKAFIDSLYAKLKRTPHLTSNGTVNNNNENTTTKGHDYSKRNKTEYATVEKPHNAFRHPPISDTKIESTANNASIGENSLIVKKKRKVRVYRIPKCETAIVSRNDKEINNNKMTTNNLNILPSETTTIQTVIPSNSNSKITSPSPQRLSTNSITKKSLPFAKNSTINVLNLYSTVLATADANTNNTQSLYTKPSTHPKKITSTTYPVHPTNNLLNKFALQPIVKVRDCNMMDTVNIKPVISKPKLTIVEKEKSIAMEEDGSNDAEAKRKHSPIIYDVAPDVKYATRHGRNARGDLRGRLKNPFDNDKISVGQRMHYNYNANKYFTEKSQQGYYSIVRRKRYQPYKP